MRFTGGAAVFARERKTESERERRERKRERWREGGWGTGVYLAQKASNFQRGCKNGVGTRVGIRRPLVGSIKRRLAFLPPTAETP